MAVQTIYTGKGLKAPQDKGHVMQALNQFSSQEQYRKTEQLNKGMKDRDDFLAMIKTDPVYLASTAANKKIAEASQGHIDKWTKIYKGSKGNLSTTDLADLQQDRGVMMAMQQFYTGINQEMMEAQKAMIQNPAKYDEQHFAEAVELFSKKGLRDDAGFLMPAINNPFQSYQGFFNNMRFQKGKANVEEIDLGGDRKQVTTRQGWNTDYTDDRLKGEFSSTSKGQYDIVGWFERNVQGPIKDKYIEQAGGDESYAANLWFKENSPNMFDETVDVSTKVWKETQDYRGREEQKTYETNGVFIYDGTPAFSSGDQVTATIGDGPGMDIVGDKMIPLPADKMKFNVPVEFEKGALIWVKPQTVIFENDKMEHSVDPSKNGQVWVIADKEDDVPMSEIIDSQELPNGKIRYKGTLKALTASSDVSLAQPKMDGLYEKNFSKQYNKWKAEAGVVSSPKEPKKKETIGDRIKNWIGGTGTKSVEEKEDEFSQYKR